MKIKALYNPRFDRIALTDGRAILHLPRGEVDVLVDELRRAAAIPALAATLMTERQ